MAIQPWGTYGFARYILANPAGQSPASPCQLTHSLIQHHQFRELARQPSPFLPMEAVERASVAIRAEGNAGVGQGLIDMVSL